MGARKEAVGPMGVELEGGRCREHSIRGVSNGGPKQDIDAGRAE